MSDSMKMLKTFDRHIAQIRRYKQLLRDIEDRKKRRDEKYKTWEEINP